MKLLLKAAILQNKWEVAAHLVVIGLVRASRAATENSDEHKPKVKKGRRA